jgi:hypothetical protein
MSGRACLLAICGLLAACRESAPAQQPAAAELPPPAAPVLTAPQPPAAIERDTISSQWTISPKGVGDVLLGAKLPEPRDGFAARYRTSFYGDAQPLEGFALDEPPVLAVVKKGPFTSWGANHPGDDPPDAIKAQALARARSGALSIGMLIITDPRPKTAEGIAVGDDYATFARAYPDLTPPEQFPALWEEPSCVISQQTLWFFFDRCDDREHAKIIRIAVRPLERSRKKGG